MFHRLRMLLERWQQARQFPLPEVVRYVADVAASADFSTFLDASRLLSATNSRRLATLLGATLPPAVLMAVVKRFSSSARHRELLACVAQEALIRGTKISTLPEIETLWGLLPRCQPALANAPS
jgi:hypothetical protein